MELRSTSRRWAGRWIRRVLLWLGAGLLLALALRQVDLGQLRLALAELRLWEIGLVLAVNVVVIQLLSLRWWFIVRKLGPDPGPMRVAIYRLAGFAISYFTPGPQFGGEPLMVRLLGRHQVAAATAAASVAMDKTIELLVNFLFLMIGLMAAIRLGLLPPAISAPAMAFAALLFSLPAVYMVAGARGSQPGSRLLARLPPAWRQSNRISRLAAGIAEAERHLSQFLRRQPNAVAAAVAASLLSWLALIGEYWLMARFMGLEVGLIQSIAVLAAARVAILLPMPGGLGTLEFSQTWAWAALGFMPAAGLALALVIRARDLVFAGIGLIAGAVLLSAEPAKPPTFERKHPVDAQLD